MRLGSIFFSFLLTLTFKSFCFSTTLTDFFDLYSRPFTTLFLEQGELDLEKIMPLYPDSVFVTLQAQDCDSINYSCPNNIVLDKNTVVNNLAHLSECEHFDSIILLDECMQLSDEKWFARLATLLSMADHVIIKAASDERRAYCRENGARIFKDGMYLFSQSNWLMKRKTWFMPLLEKPSHRVVSTFEQKLLHKDVKSKYFCSPWIAGINLITFKMCRGLYPTTQQLKDQLMSLSTVAHYDWMINNMILQGSFLQMIDAQEVRYDSVDPFHGNKNILDAHCRLMDIKSPEKIEHYFWHYLIRTNCFMRDKNLFFKELIQKDGLVFDLGACHGDASLVFLAHHCNVVAVEKNAHTSSRLKLLFTGNDYLTLVNKKIVLEKTFEDQQITLQEMINQYGVPDYCRVNIDNSYAVLLSLKTPIKALSFPFSIRDMHEFYTILNHLDKLGYKKFRASSRSFFCYFTKDWVDAKELVVSLNNFAKKDLDPDLWWGFIHAQL